MTARLATLVASILSALALTPPATAQPASPAPGCFEDLTVPEAVDLAIAQRKTLLIYASADRSEAANRMTRQVLNDPEVCRFLNEELVAIHIDVDLVPGEIPRLDLSSYPTVIALQGKEELDRISMELTKDQFLWFARGVAAGRSKRDRYEEQYLRDLRMGADDDPRIRLAHARKLMEVKSYDFATTEYLFFWNESYLINPSFREARRSSFLAEQIKTLIAAHKPARDAFTDIRDSLTPDVDPDAPNTDPETVRDWLALSRLIRDFDAIVDWTRRAIDAGRQDLLDIGGRLLFGTLTSRFEWELAGQVYADPIASLNEIRDTWGDRILRPEIQSIFLEDIAKAYAALLMAERYDEARIVADYAMDYSMPPGPKNKLEEVARTAGVPENLQKIWESTGPMPD